jgi:hypothetical protein
MNWKSCYRKIEISSSSSAEPNFFKNSWKKVSGHIINEIAGIIRTYGISAKPLAALEKW